MMEDERASVECRIALKKICWQENAQDLGRFLKIFGETPWRIGCEYVLIHWGWIATTPHPDVVNDVVTS